MTDCEEHGRPSTGAPDGEGRGEGGSAHSWRPPGRQASGPGSSSMGIRSPSSIATATSSRAAWARRDSTMKARDIYPA